MVSVAPLSRWLQCDGGQTDGCGCAPIECCSMVCRRLLEHNDHYRKRNGGGGRRGQRRLGWCDGEGRLQHKAGRSEGTNLRRCDVSRDPGGEEGHPRRQHLVQSPWHVLEEHNSSGPSRQWGERKWGWEGDLSFTERNEESQEGLSKSGRT